MSSSKAAASRAKPAKVEPARTKAVRPAAKRPARARVRPAAKPDVNMSAQAKRLAAGIERCLAKGQINALSPDALQALMAALCRTYSACLENGDKFLPLPSRTAVSPTDVMHTASGLLRGADLQVFELGMWQSWTGR